MPDKNDSGNHGQFEDGLREILDSGSGTKPGQRPPPPRRPAPVAFGQQTKEPPAKPRQRASEIIVRIAALTVLIGLLALFVFQILGR